MDYPLSFTSGALDRAAHLRSDPDIRTNSAARTLVFWRGKLLADEEGRPVLVELDHPALSDCQDAPLFIGLRDKQPCFAVDLTLWAPFEDATTIGLFTDQTRQLHPAWPEAKLTEVRSVMPALSHLDGECVATGRALLGWHGSHRFCANCGQQSVVESGGWVRKCHHCRTQHFPRTDPVVIMAITRDDKLLLGRGASWPERMYSLLAGFVEPGETIETAVRREVLEESGIKVGPVRYVTSQPWPFPMSLMLGCQGEATSEDITIDPLELVDARWVGRDEVKAVLAGTHPDISQPRAGTIAAALVSAWANGTLGDPEHWPN